MLQLNGGLSWSSDKLVPCLAVFAFNDSFILLGTNNGILRSTDGGLTFSATSITSGAYSHLAFVGNNAIIAVGSNIIRSIDGGLTWEIVGYFSIPLNFFTPSVYLGNNVSLIFADGNIKRSIDAGKTWASVHNAGSASLTSFANLGGGVVLFGGGTATGIYRSLDYGATWKIFRSGQCLGLC